MRIAILGLGAVGGHIAARLAQTDHELCVLARGDTLAALKRDGLRLRSGDQELHTAIKGSDSAAELGVQDVVICAVKATDPTGLARVLPPMLGPDTSVVFAQNGIPWWYGIGLSRAPRSAPDLKALDPEGELRATVAAKRILGAVVHSSNEVVAPAVVVNNSPARNVLIVGEPDDSASERVSALRQVLVSAGMESPEVPSIRQAIWEKLLVNMSTSMLCLLTGRKATIVAEDPCMGELFLALAAEGMAIASAHGIDMSSVNPQRFLENPPDHLPSIRQDYERGRPLELAGMILAPQAFARAAGLDTPRLDTIAALAVRMGVDAGVCFPS